MKTLLCLLLLVLTAPAAAQVFDCPDCVLGLWDDAAMTQAFGTMAPFTPKDIYLGIKFGAAQSSLTGIEFSVSGIDMAVLWVLNVQSVTSPAANIIMNSLVAPLDTTQTGGMNVAWPTCVVGSQPLLRITMACMSPVPPTNLELQVRHRYPPTYPGFGLAGPILVDCTIPAYYPYRIHGASYVLNPVVRTEDDTWGKVKGLYR